jgi:hypothetical protein
MTEYKVGDNVLVAMKISKVDSEATDDLPYLIKTKKDNDMWISENEIRDKFIEAESKLKWSHPIDHVELIKLEHLTAQLQVIYGAIDLMQHQFTNYSTENLEGDLIKSKLKMIRSELDQLDALIYWSDKEFSYKIEDSKIKVKFTEDKK